MTRRNHYGRMLREFARERLVEPTVHYPPMDDETADAVARSVLEPRYRFSYWHQVPTMAHFILVDGAR